MKQWIARLFGKKAEPCRRVTLAQFTREEDVDGVTLQVRVIEVHPPGYEMERRIELRAMCDWTDGWFDVGEIRTRDADGFAKLLGDAARYVESTTHVPEWLKGR